MSFFGRPFLPLLLAALLTASAAGRVTAPSDLDPARHSKSRHLVDELAFNTDSYFDSRTGVLRQFMEDLLKSQGQGDPKISITSVMDADSTYTTGNGDRIATLDRLLPLVDPPNINQRVLEAARDFHLSLKVFLSGLDPDIFSENPHTFLGEHAVYYSLTRKRGLIFYYLSRLTAYAVLGFLLVRFVLGNNHPFPDELGMEDLRRKRPGILKAQLVLFLVAFPLLIAVFGTYFKSRSLVTQSMSDLLFRFRDIGVTISGVLKSNQEVNSLKVRVLGDNSGRFHIQTPIADAVPLAAKDVGVVDSFISNFALPATISDFIGPLVLLSLVIIAFILDRALATKVRSSTQMGVFLCVSAALVFNLILLERDVTSLSTMNDFCLNMVRFGSQPVFPYQGIGITNLLGCSVENHVFQQLYINLIAQNAAVKIFNNEMFVIGREQVKSTDEALEVIRFLQRLESSTPAIDRLGTLLRKNTQTIQDLLKINGCNPVKAWINVAQRDVCLTSSQMAASGLGSLLTLAGVLAALLFISIIGYAAIVRHKTGQKVCRTVLHTEQFPNKVALSS